MINDAQSGDSLAMRDDARDPSSDTPDGEEWVATAGDVAATPAALATASDLGVDVSAVEGTGAGGKVTKADVEAHAAGPD